MANPNIRSANSLGNITKGDPEALDAEHKASAWIYQFIQFFWCIAIMHAVIWPLLSAAYAMLTDKLSNMLAGTVGPEDGKNLEEYQDSLDLCEKQA